MMKLIVSALLLFLASVFGFPPLAPRDAIGFKIGSDAASVRIDMFFDLLCPDSKAVWPVMQAVQKHYTTEKLQFVIHIFPLPYHQYSYFATMGQRSVVAQIGQKGFLQWLETMFMHQSEFWNAPSFDMNNTAVVTAMAKYAKQLGASEAKFISDVSNREYDGPGRIEWKFGAQRGVYGTPNFFVNDIQVSDDLTTVSGWRAILDPLLTN